MSFQAKYGGKCDACGEHIAPGQGVMYSEDDELMHSRCEGFNAPSRKAEICGTCWLTKPCDCE